MSVISEGYNSKPTHIKVYARTDMNERTAEVWLDQTGLTETDETDDRYGDPLPETLAYATLQELLNLRDEINAVIQELVA